MNVQKAVIMVLAVLVSTGVDCLAGDDKAEAKKSAGEQTAQGEDAVQKTARSWMIAVLNGQLDQLSAQAETPFCLLDRMVDTAAALKTNLALLPGEWVKTDDFRLAAAYM